MPALVPAAAALLCSLALYFTHSVLDSVLVHGRAVRLALLPGWPVLVAFVAMSALGVVWLGRRAAARPVESGRDRVTLATLTLPMFALLLLVLPYVPVVPDRAPALQVPAGPLKWVVWLTVGGLLAWTLWHTRVVRGEWLARPTLARATVLIAALTAAAATVAASRLAGTVIFPAGDEPHYLVMAQSLWRDGDLKIENNHARGDYHEYFGPDLAPDYLTRGVDGEIYSIHPVGMPVLMAPVYGLGGYWAVVAALILCASLAAALMWRFSAAAIAAPGAAMFAWAAIALTTPFLYNTFTVYPEIVAALAVAIAFTLSVDRDAWPRQGWRWALVGAACAALPWLSTKYAPMSAVLVVIALARVNPLRAPLASMAVVVPYVLSLAGWFWFFDAFWGTPLPSAPYGDLVQTSIRNVVFGVPGLLFDQEYGVLAYAPVYILAVTGLIAMWRAGDEPRRRATETVLVFGALLGTVGAFRIWWGGTASPGRPLASGLLLLMLPIATAARSAPAASARRAAHYVLLFVSIGVACTLGLAQQGLLINNGRDGTSALLEYWSPWWSLWSLAPTFIFHEAPTAWLHSLAWLGVAAIAAIALARWRTRTVGGAALAALTTFIAALVVITLAMPLLPHDPPLPQANLAARSHLAILDDYDAVTRPIGIRYDPFAIAPASSIVSLATLSVAPGVRADPQPIRVLHNGRFSLPAGNYHVDVEWALDMPRPVPIALQIGRLAPAWQTWAVQPARGAHWGVDVQLPVDASFLAFRGGTDLERAVANLTITPSAVVDAAVRPRVPPILTTLQLGKTMVLFHDDNAAQEIGGFWVLGAHTARVTFVRDSGAMPLVLRVHSGLRENRVRISSRGWQQTIALHAHTPEDIAVPDSNRRFVTIEVRPADGFMPREYDPASKDPRYLGAWVEVVPSATEAK